MLLLSVVVLIAALFSYRFLSETNRDPLHPLRVFALLTFVKTVPYLVYHAVEPVDVHPDIAKWMRGHDYDYYLALTTLAVGLCVLALYAGFQVSRRAGFFGSLAKLLPRDAEVTAVACWASLLIGVVAYIATINRIGGVQFLVESMSDRASVTAGFGYEFTFSKGLMIIGAIGIVFNAARTNSRAAAPRTRMRITPPRRRR